MDFYQGLTDNDQIINGGGYINMAICKKRLTSDHEVVKGEMPVVCKKWLTGVILNMCRSVQNRVEHAVVALRSNSLPGG